jgi:maltooligosyltrehalose trehalohydrolase
VEVAVDGRRPAPLKPGDAGVWEVTLDRVAPGTRYRYRLDGERHRPDPASRWQPEGIHGPSAVVDPTRFVWTDDAFAGHALADLVIYELHVGTFTRAGTFEAIISHLASLSELGVTALELMPVAEFPGSRNWGYDGVHLFAPQSTYGGPRGLRRLVDACHAQGLSVFLDLVYNHLGPEGNYLAEFAPYFTDRHRTPWGPAVDFDGPEAGGVRRHVVENACAWVQEYHLDGLRLDAVHALHDTSPRHILQEIAEAVHAEGERRGRPVHVIAESHDNDRRLVTPVAAGGHGLDAVWSDDFHHALHRRLTGERAGYYADFGEEGHLPRALAEGFAYQGERSTFWGRPRGTPSADLEAERFVVSVQNHDQVGNRPQGERLSSLVGPAAARLAAGLLLAAPAVPLLFMGEEYGETAPFQFFTSFLDRDLAEAARAGRVADCRHFGWDGPVPDPTDPAAFVRSRLNHPLAAAPRHRALREYYAAWLTLRRSHAALGARGKLLARAGLEEGGAVLVLTRRAASGEEVRVVANLTGAARPWAGAREPGWRALLDSEDVRFGGSRPRVPLAPYQLLVQERAR